MVSEGTVSLLEIILSACKYGPGCLQMDKNIIFVQLFLQLQLWHLYIYRIKK
jgi:hypothetical protein